MSRLNADPIATFPDGGQLLVSTAYCGEGQFVCELYVAGVEQMERRDLRVVSSLPEAPTCRQAQASAYTQARHLYPGMAEDMKQDRKSTRLNSSHIQKSRMPSSA